MDAWARLDLARQVLAVDLVGVGGLWLRGRAGPIRDIATGFLNDLPLDRPRRRLSLAIDDVALMGGIDPVATLAAGRPVRSRGVLADPALLVLPMAESAPPALVARLAQALDTGKHSLIALDEAAEDGEGLAPALSDRLGLFIDLGATRAPQEPATPLSAPQILAARRLLPQIALPNDAVQALVMGAHEMGILSSRAILFCLRVARIITALSGRSTLTPDDLTQAATLCLAHRATMLPGAEQDQQDTPPPDTPPDSAEADKPEQSAEHEVQALADQVIDAAQAALPFDVLASLAAGRAARSARGAGGSGAAKAGNRRGRPLPSRQGRPDGRSAIDIIATLRAAAPWQPLRRRDQGEARQRALLLQPGDLRLRRYREESDRVLIFAVDASGSSAVARLAEAKGAVELLLAQAYSRRDHVALVVFRGRQAELILPPTRSLVRTKQRLRGVPGGGGTPLASGLSVALACALLARRRGMTPSIALLTDGRANIALDQTADRQLAQTDAEAVARAIRLAGIPGIVLDVSNRPQPALADLSRLMDSRYVPLPRADARRIAATLG